MTYKDSIIKTVKATKYEDIVEDFTCNGKCSKCGNCCGTILPLDQEDINIIQKYIIKNKIFIQRHLLIMSQRLQCPYYTGNKEKGCAIYEARPKICRVFKCDIKSPNIEQIRRLKDTIPVDMWRLAETIEKEMKIDNGFNKKTGKKVRKGI